MCTDHSHDLGDDGGISLIESVDIESVRCLNEAVHGSCKTIIKHYEVSLSCPRLNTRRCPVSSDPKPFPPFQDRDNAEPYMESNEDDVEMIMHVPFTEGVRLTQIR